MNLFVSAGVGLALVVSGLTFSAKPASAVQAPAVATVSESSLIKVRDGYWDDRARALKMRQRCERVVFKCSKRYEGYRHLRRECIERAGCRR